MPAQAKTLLNEAADLMDGAAGERHDARAGDTTLEDDTPEAQQAQIALVEKWLAEHGAGAVINAEPLRAT